MGELEPGDVVWDGGVKGLSGIQLERVLLRLLSAIEDFDVFGDKEDFINIEYVRFRMVGRSRIAIKFKDAPVEYLFRMVGPTGLITTEPVKVIKVEEV